MTVIAAPNCAAGKQIPLSPRARGALGVVFAPPVGPQAALTAVAEGPRYLDQQNQARIGGYATVDAMVGYRWPRLLLRVSGTNLGNRRDPVVRSELGEGQFYRLPGRRIVAAATWSY